MEIKNHKLIGEGVKFLKTPHTYGNLKSFKYLIVHDDVGASMAGTESWIMNPTSKVSYHVLVGRNGEVTQFVDFNKRAYHAGVSSWKGLNDLNWHTIGICMQNTGNQAYTETQIKKAIEISKLIVKQYKLAEALGHKQIAPRRKVDPNDSFPWERFRNEVLNAPINTVVAKKVTAHTLNMRTGIGTTNPIIDVLKNGTEVHILSEKDGWSEVFVCSTKQKGFVSNEHIK